MFYWQQVLILLRKLRVSTSFMDFKQTIFLCSQQSGNHQRAISAARITSDFLRRVVSDSLQQLTSEFCNEWRTASDFTMSNEQRVNSNQLQGISQQVANYYIMKWHRGKSNPSLPAHFVRNITFLITAVFCNKTPDTFCIGLDWNALFRVDKIVGKNSN